MARKGYRDDPFEADEEGSPFTEKDWNLYAWADAWRCAVHAIEKKLYDIPEVRRAYIEAKASEGKPTPVIFVSEQSVGALIRSTSDLRGPETPSKKPKPSK